MTKKLIVLAVLAWIALQPARAQQRSTDKTPAAAAPQSVQINLGTQGIGAAYNYGILPKLALRLGLDAMPVKADNVFHFSDLNSTSNLKSKFTNIHLLADYTPFKKARWFRLVGGAGYFVSANGTLLVQPSDNYTYGDIPLTKDQVGTLTFGADWKGIAPYMGLGFFKMFPDSHRVNFNFDLGTYYLQRPKASIVGTGSLEGNSSQTAQFQENIKDYRWLPVLQFNFSYKI